MTDELNAKREMRQQNIHDWLDDKGFSTPIIESMIAYRKQEIVK